MKTELLPAARDDLAAIWLFGADRWGDRAADTYARSLMTAIGRLADNPLRAPVARDVPPGYRRLVSGSHVVFYRVTEEAVLVVRVLHASRDAGAELG